MKNNRETYTIKERFDCLNKKMLVVRVEDKACCVMSQEEYDKIMFMYKKNQRKKNRKYIEKNRKLA